MKILDVVILLLSVANAQSKYVVCNRSNLNMYKILFSLIRLYSPIWESVVKTNHNLDTQYTTSEIQTRQENIIKKRTGQHNW